MGRTDLRPRSLVVAPRRSTGAHKSSTSNSRHLNSAQPTKHLELTSDFGLLLFFVAHLCLFFYKALHKICASVVFGPFATCRAATQAKKGGDSAATPPPSLKDRIRDAQIAHLKALGAQVLIAVDSEQKKKTTSDDDSSAASKKEEAKEKEKGKKRGKTYGVNGMRM